MFNSNSETTTKSKRWNSDEERKGNERGLICGADKCMYLEFIFSFFFSFK